MINNLQKSVKLPIKEIKKIISVILKSMGSEKAVIGVTLVDDRIIHELNKKYRKKNKPTDVLSFALRDGKISTDISADLIGDVVISIETTIRQAKDYKHSFEKEFKILLIHGILHLFGYDHIKEKDYNIMKKKEKTVFILIEDLQLKPK